MSDIIDPTSIHFLQQHPVHVCTRIMRAYRQIYHMCWLDAFNLLVVDVHMTFYLDRRHLNLPDINTQLRMMHI